MSIEYAHTDTHILTTGILIVMLSGGDVTIVGILSYTLLPMLCKHTILFVHLCSVCFSLFSLQ